MVTLIQIVDYLLGILQLLIIVQVVLSWLVAFNVVNTSNAFVRQLLYALDRITEPLYRPIRRILPDFGGLDFSGFIVLLVIDILRRFVLPALAAQVAGPAYI